MKIAFFGSSLLSAYWNGAATYYRGIIRQLHLHGHEVTFYEPDAYDRQSHRDIDPPPWAGSVVYEPTEEAVFRHLEKASGADLIVKASGVGVHDALLERAVLDARRSGQAVVFWDVDAPATLERLETDAADPFRALIPRYDAILTYGGGEPVRSAYEQLGARYCQPIYNAMDPDIHHPAKARPEFAADLSFLGNRLPDRESRVEEFFFKAAARCPDFTYLLGGSGWADKERPGNVRWVGHVGTGNHNAFNASARVVLNISRSSMASTGFSPATRVFEAAGAGACLITDAWEGIESFFEPGEEILVAKTGDEVAVHSRISAGQARRVGEAALKRALAEHTYSHRAAEFENLFSGALA